MGPFARMCCMCLAGASMGFDAVAQPAGNAPLPATGTQAAEVQVGAGTRTEATTGASGGEEQSASSGNGGPPDVLAVCGDVDDAEIRRNCMEKTEQ